MSDSVNGELKDCANYEMFLDLSDEERRSIREKLEALMHILECDQCLPLFYAEG